MEDNNKLLFKKNKFSSKVSARKYFKEIRKTNNLFTNSLIIDQVKDYIKHLEAKKGLDKYIGIYWPLEGETDLRPLKKYVNSKLALPACTEKGKITYHEWTNDPLEKDIYGIPSPLSQPTLKASEIKLLIVPAIAIDRMGTRLGYGSGSFDRLREKTIWKAIEALVVIPNKCISSFLLPKDDWDIPFNGWINEKEIYKIKTVDNK